MNPQVVDPPPADAAVSRGLATPVGLALAVLVTIVTVLLPTPEGLTPAGKNLVGVFAVALILWVTEAIPIAVTSFLVIVLGGAGNYPGALLGGLLLGLVEQLASLFLTTQVNEAVAYVLLVLVLLIRPTGLLKGRV